MRLVDESAAPFPIKPGYTWFAYLVKRYGLNHIHEIPATMSVANFVADPHYIQQAFATSEPFFAHQAGIETRVLFISETGYNPYRVMFTTRDFLRQHPEAVAGFVRASLQRMAGLPQRSRTRSCCNRQIESRAQPGVDAVPLAGITRRAIHHGGMSRVGRKSAR